MRHRRIATLLRHRPFEADPYFGSVVVLLPLEAQSGITNPVDKSRVPKAFAGTGAGTPPPQILKRRSRWSHGAWWTGANVDNRLTTPDSADFNFGSGDFDIRMDLVLISAAADLEILAHRALADAANLWFVRKTATQKIRVLAKTSSVDVTDLVTTASFPTDGNTFTTLHIRRRSGVVQIAFNGLVQAVTGTNNAGAWPNAAAQLIVGNGDDTYANGVAGYFSYLRITKGVARDFAQDWRWRMRQPVPVY